MSNERRRPRGRILVLDTECATDATQALTFGCYAYLDASSGLELLEEGLFHADDVRATDPHGLAVLDEYAREHQLPLLTCRQFLKDVFYPAAWQARATVVGFNLPFDLARIASGWGEARAPFPRGFSLILWQYPDRDGVLHENRFRPRIAIKSIDNKRALKGFVRPRRQDETDRPSGHDEGPRPTFRGHFLDLRTLAFALTDRGHSLASACEAFGVKDGKARASGHGEITEAYVAYCRQDVKASAALYQTLIAQYRRHPIDLQPTKAYSPASIGKAYLKAMGLEPILTRQPDFPREILGYGMVAYYGGRAECRIRRTPVPVVYCDFISMYPTVNALMGLWRHVTARRVEAREATAATRRFVRRITLSDCFERRTWRRFVTLVQVAPDDDVLPARAAYEHGGDWQIGINPLTSEWPLWYALPDVIAAKLLTGKTPRIIRAITLVPIGKQSGLKPVLLHGQVRINPRRRDFFTTVIEERKRHNSPFLKVLANAASYGILAEIRRRELPTGETAPVCVYGLHEEPFETKVAAPEEPGPFSFPPLAACITAAARLMLAMLERTLTNRGGTYAFCDTDSMAIVATRSGGLVRCPGGVDRDSGGFEAVRALSWSDVEEIRRQFERLNPYNPDVLPGSILELEKENRDSKTGRRRQLHCYAISAKRYALYNLDRRKRPRLRKWSEHGLGHVLSPKHVDDQSRDWIRETWRWIVNDALSVPARSPRWLARPAISRVGATSPRALAPFKALNTGKPYTKQIKPHNFLLAAHVAAFGHPLGTDPRRFQLIAPFEPDPDRWLEIEWTDRYTGSTFQISTTGEPSARLVRVKTYRDLVDEYRTHPERKSADPAGQASSRRSIGLLARRPLVAATLTYIGKESNALDELESETVHDIDEVLTEYHDPRLDPFETRVVPVLRRFSVSRVSGESGLHPRSIERILRGNVRPHARNRRTLSAIAMTLAENELADGTRGLAALARLTERNRT